MQKKMKFVVGKLKFVSQVETKMPFIYVVYVQSCAKLVLKVNLKTKKIMLIFYIFNIINLKEKF